MKNCVVLFLHLGFPDASLYDQSGALIFVGSDGEVFKWVCCLLVGGVNTTFHCTYSYRITQSYFLYKFCKCKNWRILFPNKMYGLFSRVPNIEKVLSLRSLINRNNMQIICIPKIRNIILVLKFICRTHIMWSHLIKIDILWGDPNQPFTHDVIICTFFIFIRIDYL